MIYFNKKVKYLKKNTQKSWQFAFLIALKKWGLYWICSVLPSFCLSIIIQMKLEYLWGQLAIVDQILYEASLGWGKGCIRFWDKLDQNTGFHGNRKHPLTYNGENNVHLFSVVFYQIFFKLAGNEDRHKISNKVDFWPDRTTLYRVRCPWASEKFPIDLYWENGISKLARSFFIRSSSNLLVTRTGINSWKSLNSSQIGSFT